jgi:hypothetical protein
MSAADKTIHTYEQIAEWYDRQGLDQLRDRFLVLAADAAFSSGDAVKAEEIRAHLLERNPHHLLKPYASVAEAFKNPEVQNYVSGLRRGYPPESMGSLLEALRSGKSPPVPGAVPKPKPKPAEPEPDADEEGTLRMQKPPTIPPGKAPVKGPAKAPEPPAVYPVKDEGAPAKPEPPRPREIPAAPPRTAPPAAQRVAKGTSKPPPARPHPAPLPKPPRPSPPARAAEPAPIYAVKGEPGSLPRHREEEREDDQPAAGAWLPSALFVVLLVAGAALAAYTFAAPFVPR